MTSKQIQAALEFAINTVDECEPGNPHTKVLEYLLDQHTEIDISDWIVEWANMWPTKAQVESYTGKVWGYSPRVTGPTVVKRMQGFLKNFNKFCPFAKHLKTNQRLDIIERATMAYLKEREQRNWEFTKKSVKFISDNDGSILASYIESEINGKTVKDKFAYYG